MNTQDTDKFHRSNQILLGFETLYPEKPVIPKVRFALESLTFHRSDVARIYSDFFMILKSSGHYPMTSYLEHLVFAKNGKEQFDAILKLLDHLSYEPLFEEIRLIVSHFAPGGDDNELERLLTMFLNQRAKEPRFHFCKQLVSIFLEKSEFTKIKKILDLYEFLYDDDVFPLLKKSYEHFLSLDSELQFYAYLHKNADLPSLDAVKDLRYGGVGARFEESFSKSQMKSKMWALEMIRDLSLDVNTALVLCGWFGVLPSILLENGFDKVVSLDIDEECEAIAKRINIESYHSGRFQAMTRDILKLDYSNYDFCFHDTEDRLNDPDILINTSCEHIPNFKEWYDMIPEGQLMLLQSNDFFDCEEHVNCVNSTAEFRDQTPMTHRLFSGAYPMELYTRYMVIGYK